VTEAAASANNGEGGQPKTPPAVGHTLSVRVMQNTAALLVGRGLALVLAAAATFLLVRCLAPEQYGQYAAIYALLGLFTWVASWGVGPLVSREAALNREQAGSIVFTGVCISAAFAVGATLLVFALAPVAHLGGRLYPLLIIASVEVLLSVPFALPAVIFQLDLQQWYSSLFNVIRQVLWFGVAVAAYFLGAPLLYIVAGRVAAALIETGLNWHYGRRRLKPPAIFLSPLAKRLIRGGLVITLTTVAATIYLRIDVVMLHRMATDAALGQYAAAGRISEFFEALPAASGPRISLHDSCVSGVEHCSVHGCAARSAHTPWREVHCRGSIADDSGLVGDSDVFCGNTRERDARERPAAYCAVADNWGSSDKYRLELVHDSALRRVGRVVGDGDCVLDVLDHRVFAVSRMPGHCVGRDAPADSLHAGCARGDGTILFGAGG
jgi:hypothetical protein